MAFREFIEESWPIIEPGTKFEPNWHIDLLAEYLEAVTEGQIDRLIVNMPPRMGKSSIVTVQWPVWEWTTRPETRALFCSYAHSLSIKHSEDRRIIIKSPWYQERWGGHVQLADDQDEKSHYRNKRMGHHLATAIGGAQVGHGGSRVVVDDPQDPRRAESKIEREGVNAVFDRQLTTRLDDPKESAIVIVMQRLHEQDLCGHVLKQQPGRWTVLDLEGYPEKKRVYKAPITKRKFTQKAREPLFPAKQDEKALKDQSEAMGTRSFNAQWNQRPVSAKGNIIHRSWFKFYRELPTQIFSIWSWDTAHKAGEENSFCVGLRIVECANGFYFTNRMKEHMEFPEQKKAVENCYNGEMTDEVIIEDKATGPALTQELSRDTKIPIKPIPVDTDKTTRLILVSPLFEAGKVFLPEGAPWVEDFIQELCAVPNAAFNDQADSASQGLSYLKNKPKPVILSLGRK